MSSVLITAPRPPRLRPPKDPSPVSKGMQWALLVALLFGVFYPTTYWQYDKVGNKTQVKDGLNQETDFTYDGLKRNLTKVDEENNTTAFVYNAADKIERIAGDGGHTVYAYDKRHRVTQVSYKWSSTGAAINDGANPTRTYTYDGAGNLLAVSEPAKDYSLGEVAYTYDALKRILTETSNNVTHTYRYDLAGNRIFCAYGGISSGPAGWYLSSAYDEQNRLTSLGQVSTGTLATLATTYTYDLNGNILVKAMPTETRIRARTMR